MVEKPIRRFVLTGGPGGGKSSGLARLMEELPDCGVTPIAVPELATLISTNGVRIGDLAKNPELLYRFQKEMLRSQLSLEDSWMRFAGIQPGDDKVLLCDRGAMDVAAYVSGEQFTAIAGEIGQGIVDLKDGRYDAVFHLVTAADGAEAFYNHDNPARYETLEQARERDKKTLEVWNGHEHLRVIGNYEVTPSGERRPINFETKMKRLVKEVRHQLGIPAPIEIERWFLIAPGVNPPTFPVSCKAANIRQTYLLPTGNGFKRRVRERECGGLLHIYNEKQEVRSGVRLEREHIITIDEYRKLLFEADPTHRQILKSRHSFVWQDQYFQLDILVSPLLIVRLEVEQTEEHERLTLPPFLNIIRDVTDDERYSNAAIADGRCPGYNA